MGQYPTRHELMREVLKYEPRMDQVEAVAQALRAAYEEGRLDKVDAAEVKS